MSTPIARKRSIYIDRKRSLHTETSQLISMANQMTGFYMTQPFTENYFQTDSNNISCIIVY